MTMRVTLDLDGNIAQAIENKINEKLPEVIEEVLAENIDELLKDIVVKQLRGAALIYIQGQDFRQKMMDKVRPKVNEMVGIE